jgi:predicted nucleic acid-binding protein
VTQFLLDTSVLIDVLRERNQRRPFLAHIVREGHTLATTALNVAELRAGLRPSEEERTEALLRELECIDVTGPTARLAGKLKREWSRRGRTLALVDAVVAAIAIDGNYSLLTDNGKDFPMPELHRVPLPSAEA